MSGVARRGRLDAPDILHHAMARGNDRRSIFVEDADYADFLARLEAVAASTGVRASAWRPIPNRFHLRLRTGDVALSSVMRKEMAGYAGALNCRHERHGRLFWNRYQEHRPERAACGLRRGCPAWLDLPAREGRREPVVPDARVLGNPRFAAFHQEIGHGFTIGRTFENRRPGSSH